jgi:phosphopantetheinyl transferase
MVSKNKRVGIDIELPNSRVLAISHKFLHKTELEEFNNDNKLPTTNYELLTVLWCAKEAIFKWWSFGSVDFRDNIRLQHFALETEGSINASFNKEGKSFELQLHYKLFEKFCLVWLMS